MIIIKTKNYEELSKKAADIIGSVVILKPDAVLGLATGSTPVGTYKELIKGYEEGKLDFSKVKLYICRKIKRNVANYFGASY